jgi:hypothetical protein
LAAIALKPAADNMFSFCLVEEQPSRKAAAQRILNIEVIFFIIILFIVIFLLGFHSCNTGDQV